MEASLEKLENDWAKFCETASGVKSKFEDKYGKWKEFRSDCDKMQIILNECESTLKPEIRRGIDLQGIDIELKKLKVFLHQLFLYLNTIFVLIIVLT